ncbi:MAG: rRNA maturation RNase YbeY [Chloroflexi bacterium]|nr:rRNA maturation RNase YbeY [Chloroflexota bacterium]
MEQEYVTVTIEVDEPYTDAIDTAELERLTEHVLRGESVAGPVEVSIWITNEEELHTPNRTYRNVDSSTDVLSFGEDEDADTVFVSAPDQPRYIGDLAISYPHAVRQAEEYNHSLQRELSYLVTHGLLHLLGYDHEAPEDGKLMRGREEALLGALGITRES